MGTERPRHVFLACGEASGDRYGAALARALREHDPALRITGLGGPALGDAGVEIIRDSADLAVMGFAEVARRLPALWDAYRSLASHLKHSGVDLFIPIDFPGFNGRLAGVARGAGVPVFWLVAPQVWAWGAWRIGRFRRRIDLLGTVLPFEGDYFREHGFDVFPMGHPLMEDYGDNAAFEARLEARERRLSDPVSPVTVGLLPGSRRQELDQLLPVLKVAAGMLGSLVPGRDLEFLVSAAPGVDPDDLDRRFDGNTTVSTAPLAEVLPTLDLAVVCSGTASLETALAGVPHDIVYRTGALNFWLGRRLVRTPHIGLANLVGGGDVVPERVQSEAAPMPVARGLEHWLNRAAVRAEFYEDVRRVRTMCGRPGVWDRTARRVCDLLAERRP
ncbi:MAG: lipid-A-disaccharide synthase [bacterium]|nr:lipid-A-disaccharide synthase [bacterium]